MDGIGGKKGWAWIFIIEGLASVLFGIISFWMIHNFPAEAKFLSEPERARVLKRLRDDNQASAEHAHFRWKDVRAAYTDWKLYAYSVIYMGCDGALYAFSQFQPSIVNALGYHPTIANLLSVPPYALAAIGTVFIGWLADKTKVRGPWNILCSLLGVVGFAMELASQKVGVKYAGLFLGALGIYPCIANTTSWGANNSEGVFKRGVFMGTFIGWGNFNGIIASEIYRSKDKPKYYPGHGTVLAYMALFLLGGTIVTDWMLMRENKKRREGKRDYLIEGKTEEEIKDLGDYR